MGKSSDKVVTKAIVLPKSLVATIEKNAYENGRNFSSEVRFILREYYKSIGVK